MKNILVPTDLSPEAEVALKVGLDIAQSIKGEVILLHIIDAPNAVDLSTQGAGSSSSIDQIFTLKLIERMKEDLQELVEPFGEDAPLRTEMAIGNMVAKINERIDSEDIDLVVMGTKGASGIQEVVVGSNTEKVVRAAKCPVLTVKSDSLNAHPNDIVFASDFMENASYDNVVRGLKQFQQHYEATVHLLFVNTPNKFELSSRTDARMKDFVKKYDLRNVTYNIYNHKDEEEGIMEFAELNEMDLVSVATHSRRGLAHLLSGSITEGLVNHSTKPVLSFSLKHMK